MYVCMEVYMNILEGDNKYINDINLASLDYIVLTVLVVGGEIILSASGNRIPIPKFIPIPSPIPRAGA